MNRLNQLLVSIRFATCAGALALGTVAPCYGQSADKAATEAPAAEKESPAIAEIRKTADEFEKAYEAGDAKALAATFAKEGEYQDDTGIHLKGRDEIEKAYAKFFKDSPKRKMEVKILSIKLPSPDVAIEDGTILTEAQGNELPSTSRYQVMHVKEDGQWKSASVHEWNEDKNSIHELNWLVGKWQAKSDTRTLTLSFEANSKNTILTCTFRLEDGGKVTSEGTQTICEDPRTGKLHSWSFYDDGGTGEAVWHHDGTRWVLESSGWLGGGEPVSALNIISRVNANEFSFHSTERTIGDQFLPDAKPVKVVRVGGKGTSASK